MQHLTEARATSAWCFSLRARATSISKTAARLAVRARGRAKIVALVVDADDEELGEIIDAVAPDMLQLHGRETPERAAEIARLFKVPLIKAVAVGTP